MEVPKQPWIETPLIWSRGLSQRAGCDIYLKLENTQPSGSFKSRGMGAFVATHLPSKETSHPETPKPPHFFCSSGGNAGLGCVSAAVTYGCPATIVVPMSTSSFMISKLKDAGAREVIQTGASWFEADDYLKKELLPKAREEGENPVYVPPFDHPSIWDGHSTMVDEIVRQLPGVDQHYPSFQTNSTKSKTESGKEEEEAIELPDAIICSVGGGGLLNGIIQGLARYPSTTTPTKVLAVETSGADSLSQSVHQSQLITLPNITSIATTLGARTVSSQAFEYAMDPEKRIQCAVLTDKEAVGACRDFANEERMLVEPACAVSLAVVYSGRLGEFLPGLGEGSRVVIVVCGGSGLSLGILGGYIERFFPEEKQ